MRKPTSMPILNIVLVLSEPCIPVLFMIKFHNYVEHDVNNYLKWDNNYTKPEVENHISTSYPINVSKFRIIIEQPYLPGIDHGVE